MAGLLKRFITILIIVLIIISCGTYVSFMIVNRIQKPIPLKDIHTINFRVDASFSKKELNTIKEVLTEWEVASQGCLYLNMYVSKISYKEFVNWQEDKIPTIYNASDLLAWKYHIGKYLCMESGTKCLGVTLTSTGDMFLIKNDEHLFKSLVLHEIGHVIGFKHSNVKTELMYPIMAFPKEISNVEELLITTRCKIAKGEK